MSRQLLDYVLWKGNVPDSIMSVSFLVFKKGQQRHQCKLYEKRWADADDAILAALDTEAPSAPTLRAGINHLLDECWAPLDCIAVMPTLPDIDDPVRRMVGTWVRLPTARARYIFHTKTVGYGETESGAARGATLLYPEAARVVPLP